ncbi:MAG: hypothetical protein K2Q14_06050 [Gammaproteobacteria bacterium]|nr:hypothetical protein [Gammaproteobacteria bacterium]
MKTYRHVVLSLMLVSSTATFADVNLSVAFTGQYTGNSQCVQTRYIGVHYDPAPAPFSIVVKNTNVQHSIIIRALTFNGHPASDGYAGLPDVSVDANTPAEQQRLLQSCNGKQLAPAGQMGDSCTIPLLYHYPDYNTPTLTNNTLNVTAISNVGVPGLKPSSNMLNLNMGGGTTGSDFSVTLSNVDANQTDYGSSLPQSTALHTGDIDVLYYKGLPSLPATFAYSIKNLSNQPKTVGTRCLYSVIGGGTQLPTTIANVSQCDTITLAPGKTCQSVISVMPPNANLPGSSTGSGLFLMLSVIDNASPIAAPADRTMPRMLFMGSGR